MRVPDDDSEAWGDDSEAHLHAQQQASNADVERFARCLPMLLGLVALALIGIALHGGARDCSPAQTQCAPLQAHHGSSATATAPAKALATAATAATAAKASRSAATAATTAAATPAAKAVAAAAAAAVPNASRSASEPTPALQRHASASLQRGSAPNSPLRSASGANADAHRHQPKTQHAKPPRR